MNDLALIDEVSGLTEFLENVMHIRNLDETGRERIKARMHYYDSPVPKEVALNEMSMKMFGDNR